MLKHQYRSRAEVTYQTSELFKYLDLSSKEISEEIDAISKTASEQIQEFGERNHFSRRKVVLPRHAHVPCLFKNEGGGVACTRSATQ